MAKLTKISPYRNGEVRFGLKSHSDNWDNSVKVSYLPPEELEKYRNGEHGGSKLYTYDDYLKWVDEGKTKEEIAKLMGISVATLYNRLKVWKKQPLEKKVNKAEKPKKEDRLVLGPPVEVEQTKAEDIKQLIKELKAELVDREVTIKEVCADRDRYVAEAQKHYNRAEDLALKVDKLEVNLIAKQETIDEVMGTKDRLEKELGLQQAALWNCKKENDELAKRCERYADDFMALEELVKPLKQLVFSQLKREVERG